MKNYLSNFGKTLNRGFYSILKGMESIAEGMGTFSIYPPMNRKISSDRESIRKDYEAIESDWEKIGEDIEKARKEFSSKNNLESGL